MCEHLYILDSDTNILGYCKTDQTFIEIEYIELITNLSTSDSTNC